MMHNLEKSIQAAKDLQSAVANRRSAWPTAAKIIDQCLADFDQRWTEVGGDSHFIEKRTNQQSPFGIRTINSNCVAMQCGLRYTGISQTIDSPSGKSFQNAIEQSGKLLFSQMPDGHILVLATPPTSNVKKVPFEQLILHISIPPSAINYRLVENAIQVYLWLQRIAGYQGRTTFIDRLRLFWYWLKEWRHTNDFAAWAIFWATVITLILAAISASADLKAIFGTTEEHHQGAIKAGTG